MSTPVIIMMICVGMALLIIDQHDDDDDARRYVSLVMPRRYIINDVLRHHLSFDFLQFINNATPWLTLNDNIREPKLT